MERFNWQVVLGVFLLLLSVFFYFLHYLVFKDTHHIFIFLVGDVAFVFIEVLLVTLIIHRVMEQRERKSRLEKLNMVIGAFFSEVGSKLLEMLSQHDPGALSLQQKPVPETQSAAKEFQKVCSWLARHDYDIDMVNLDWDGLKTFLLEKRDFLLRLLENSSLMEHESFTDMLWAVFHFAEELEARDDFQGLPETDYRHLYGDIKRVYRPLAREWVEYMKHLQLKYPYLFSLATRMNPFNRNASPVLRGT